MVVWVNAADAGMLKHSDHDRETNHVTRTAILGFPRSHSLKEPILRSWMSIMSVLLWLVLVVPTQIG